MYTSRDDDANIKLTDFGLALLYPGASVTVHDDNLVGTPGLVGLPALYGTQLMVVYNIFFGQHDDPRRSPSGPVSRVVVTVFWSGEVRHQSSSLRRRRPPLYRTTCWYGVPTIGLPCLRFTSEVVTLTLPVPDKLLSRVGSWPIHHSTFSFFRTDCVRVSSAGPFTNISSAGFSFEIFQRTSFGDVSCSRLVAVGALNAKRCLSVCVF